MNAPATLIARGEAANRLFHSLKREADLRDAGAFVLNTAMAIADDTARSDVECYARHIDHPNQFVCYDIHEAEVRGVMTEDDKAEAVAIAQRAARYIEARGEALPFRMVRVDGSKRLVRFIDKEPQS